MGSGDINANDALDIANKYYKVENYPEAMRYYTLAMQKAQEEHNDRVYVVSVGYISNVYFNYSDYTRALHYLLKGYDKVKDGDNVRIQSSYLTNIIATYCRLNDPKNARIYYDILCQLPQEGLTVDNDYYIMYNYGRILKAEKKYDEAMKQFKKTWQFAESNKMAPIYSLNLRSEIGNLLVETGRYDEAIAYGLECEKESRKIGSMELLANACQMLADAYGKVGDSVNAQHYRQLYNETADSVYNLPNLTSASTDLFKYENSQNEEQISSLTSSMNHLTLIVVIFGVLIALMVILFFMVFRNNKRMNEGQLKLLEENRDILAKTVSTVKERTPAVKDGPECEKMRKLLAKINDVLNDGTSISDPDFSLQKLADAVGSNTKYVSQVINEYFNMNFKTLLNEYRLREATRRLSDEEHYGNMTIQAIYEDVGYKNAVSFIRAFKRMYGMTPSEYQKKAKTTINNSQL
ncbi:MAG: helix-turn-helix domain-containing protein [Prevotella sp.]